MNPVEYLEAIKSLLIEEAIIAGFHVRRERTTLTDGHIRARLNLIGGSMLEFSEYFQVSPDDEIVVATYSYHWADADGTLINRWDNTPHHRELAGFPHHIHTNDGKAIPGKPTSIFEVVGEIAQNLR